MHCTVVSHTHWDREWYRSFQVFRARLVDTVDRVLDLIERDPDYSFQLDGQCIAVEDYLEIRPERRAELEAACRSGRVAIGPWYVQPDSLLPSGEAHIRNLLEGRRVAESIGDYCRVAYTPDSFGHPAQFPQLFAGFGLAPFIYWRGNGNEIDSLGSVYRWRSPDGSSVCCYHLAKGYFAAFGFGNDISEAVKRLQTLARELRETSPNDSVLFMNGMDHMFPDANTREVTEALAQKTGWKVERGLLEGFAHQLPKEGLAEFSGELLGARVANLLPGVWSSRMSLKLANRRCEAALEGWAEPWSALAHSAGAPDESPSLRLAWRSLLANQAHDSICGCSRDIVHTQMATRYQTALELADQTTERCLERIAGLGVTRQVERRGEIEIAVFNPSPHLRTDRVRLALDGFPAFTTAGISSLLAANIGIQGFEVDGHPARLIPIEPTQRPSPLAGQTVYDIEFIARDVPALGWKRFALRPSIPYPDVEDDGTSIETENIQVRVEPSGALSVRIGKHTWSGLAVLEDRGDRGDSYDFDGLASEAHESEPWPSSKLRVRRRYHPGGISELHVQQVLRVPKSLTKNRKRRSRREVDLPISFVARITEGIERVDLSLRFTNTAMDHRLRLLFPTRRPTSSFFAATTFDTAMRSTRARDASDWVHPAPATFPHQGWVAANGLAVVAPGLPEAEVTPDGCIKLCLVRATGWLARSDLISRTGEAGPHLATPDAQCLESTEVTLSLLTAPTDQIPSLARDAELGLRAVAAGSEPLIPNAQPLLTLEPRELVLSALKPAQSGEGVILRVLNPGTEPKRARVSLGFDVAEALAVRLDETPCADSLSLRECELEFPVAPHALRSILLRRI